MHESGERSSDDPAEQIESRAHFLTYRSARQTTIFIASLFDKTLFFNQDATGVNDGTTPQCENRKYRTEHGALTSVDHQLLTR